MRIILAEWDEFKELDLVSVSQLKRYKNIENCRNLLDPSKAKKNGFNYQGIDR